MSMTVFSQRSNFVKVPMILQLNEMNDELRIGIYNVLRVILGEYGQGSAQERICQNLWMTTWHQPIDAFPCIYEEFYSSLYDHIMSIEWYAVYDLIELFFVELNKTDLLEFCLLSNGLLSGNSYPVNYQKEFVDRLNYVLDYECSGYRFIKGQVVPIVNEIELETLEQSLENDNSMPGAAKCIEKSLGFLSRRPDPDYLNSVKESISAAEAAAKTFIPGKAKTLADAVTNLEKERGLHKSIADAWKKMFGYTSDANGIRHAGSDEPVQLDFAFAKYMLVTCSAFVNYLAEEYGPNE